MEPIDTAMPLKITQMYKLFRINYQFEVYLYSVGNNSTAMQYIRLMPALESASNTADNIRFCVEDVMKYKKAAETPEPTKLTTK